MLKKKNYKEQDHFTQFFSATIPQMNGKTITIYYKRYRPKNNNESDVNIYTTLRNSGQSKKDDDRSEYPIDRTLEIISFDQNLSCVEKVVRKIGKIRKILFGESTYKSKEIWYAIAIFKYEFDLIKCFRDNNVYMQTTIDDFYKGESVKEEDKQAHRQELICNHLKVQLSEEQNKLKQLQHEGYNVITDKFGKYSMNYEANSKFIENLPQIKKQKKMAMKKT